MDTRIERGVLDTDDQSQDLLAGSTSLVRGRVSPAGLRSDLAVLEGPERFDLPGLGFISAKLGVLFGPAFPDRTLGVGDVWDTAAFFSPDGDPIGTATATLASMPVVQGRRAAHIVTEVVDPGVAPDAYADTGVLSYIVTGESVWDIDLADGWPLRMEGSYTTTAMYVPVEDPKAPPDTENTRPTLIMRIRSRAVRID